MAQFSQWPGKLGPHGLMSLNNTPSPACICIDLGEHWRWAVIRIRQSSEEQIYIAIRFKWQFNILQRLLFHCSTFNCTMKPTGVIQHSLRRRRITKQEVAGTSNTVKCACHSRETEPCLPLGAPPSGHIFIQNRRTRTHPAARQTGTS